MAAKSKGKKGGKVAVKRSSYFAIEGEKATLRRRYCPRCGTGVVLAEHADRDACGRCGYTEFRK
ncbi:MAG TPA: 30S ribosomal protein S27ae [Methanoregulaceae archaeon]|nr:30S ribosomal protein S27ae [Methanoregulaceae archaeon]HOV68357.1 30S ribosomal protein S27ae [Methanoregulaceae archaeon]HQJ88112.1 30S ribosomal protein S27ae [Methanoregulaceae archaeon]